MVLRSVGEITLARRVHEYNPLFTELLRLALTSYCTTQVYNIYTSLITSSNVLASAVHILKLERYRED